jgi:hypothetical protein
LAADDAEEDDDDAGAGAAGNCSVAMQACLLAAL